MWTELFGIFDLSDRGVISVEDVPALLECGGFANLPVETVHNVQRAMDDGHGNVTRKSFLAHVPTLGSRHQGESLGPTMFRHFDLESTGIVSAQNVISVSSIETHALTDKECKFVTQQLSERFPTKGLTFDEFVSAVKRTVLP